MSIDDTVDMELETFKKENYYLHKAFTDYINEPKKDFEHIKDYTNFINRFKPYLTENIIHSYLKMYCDTIPDIKPYNDIDGE